MPASSLLTPQVASRALCFWTAAWKCSSLSHRALQESILANAAPAAPAAPLREASSFDRDLQLAMELSVREQQERKRQQEEEEAELQQALRLSLLEN